MQRPIIDGAARKAGYEKLRDDLLEIRTKIADVEESADSPDGLVTATVVGRGELSELYLDPRVYRNKDSRALAKSIVDAVKEAVVKSQDRIFDITRAYLPGEAGRDETDVHTDPFMHQLDKRIDGAERI